MPEQAGMARDPADVLKELRLRSENIRYLALVMRAARTLGEWSDAQDALARFMESAGDLLDQVDEAHLGFVGGRRKVQPTPELLARGRRLEGELHHFCQQSIYEHDGCSCSDCESVRRFKLEEVE